MMREAEVHQARQWCTKRGGNGERGGDSTASWRGGAMREEAMQQPTSLREAQEERMVAQQERDGAIEWQRSQ